jgi:hypothetical protein
MAQNARSCQRRPAAADLVDERDALAVTMAVYDS